MSQLPFGYLAERFGGRFVFAFTGVSVGGISLLMPTAARWSPYTLMALRALQGLCQVGQGDDHIYGVSYIENIKKVQTK